MLHKHRHRKVAGPSTAKIECVGLTHVRTWKKPVAHPIAAKDAQGTLRVEPRPPSQGGHERHERLIDAGVTDRGDTPTPSSRVLEAVTSSKRLSNAVKVIAGNIATRKGAQALIDAGAERVNGRFIGRDRSAPPACRRGRRAATDRDHGRGGSAKKANRAVDCDGGNQNIPAIRQGARTPAHLVMGGGSGYARRHDENPRAKCVCGRGVLQGLSGMGSVGAMARARRQLFSRDSRIPQAGCRRVSRVQVP